MNGTVVRLEPHELLMGAEVAIRRRVASLERGLQDRYGYNGDHTWEQEITSSLAELAVAKALGRYWDGSVNTFKRGDVSRLQVRFTLHAEGRLIIRAEDADQDVFVLVIGLGPREFHVAGWIRGRDGRKPQWLTRPDPGRLHCWAVPQDALRPVKENGDAKS